MLSDQEILALLDTKPEKGIKKLTQAYGGLVYAIVRGRFSGLLSEQDAEECVCDVLYEAYEKRERIDLRDGTLKGFLALTAKRRAIDRCRQAMRRGNVLSLDDETVKEPDSGEDLQHSLELEALRTVLAEEINALGSPDSDILIRKYYYGQRSREIAKALGMKENTVDQRARRSLEKLRKQENLMQLLGGGYHG